MSRVLYLQGYIFNKISRGIVQKPDEVGKQNWQMIIVKTRAWQCLGILWYIFGGSEIFKMSLKIFENSGKTTLVKIL